ncbi:MAG: protein kinase [Actinomycetota bacterium]
MVGTELGGYKISSVIGRGGMGVVYRATDDLGGLVALKVMAPELARSPAFEERFIRESQTAIDHPNIVPIYEAGQDGDLLYIAMRLVEGIDLKTLILKEGRLLPNRTADVCWQAATALDAAHESGIVHRDVKPQNILLESSDDGGGEHVFLSDFGLVKRVASQSSFTDSTYLVGSVQYMPPEQIEGKEVDGRSDVYALGCVLYECLTGAVPFEKETEVAVLFAHLNETPPSVTTRVPVLGEGVDLVISKAMAKAPKERYLTAGEFASALRKELGVSASRRRSVWAPGQMGTSRRSRPVYRSRTFESAGPRGVAASRRGWAAAAAAILLMGTVFLLQRDGSSSLIAPSYGPLFQALDESSADETGPDEFREESASRDDPKRSSSNPTAARTVGGSGENQPSEVTSKKRVSGLFHQSPTEEEVAEGATQWLFFTRSISGTDEIFRMRPDGRDLMAVTSNSHEDITPDLAPGGRRLVFATSRWGKYRHLMTSNPRGGRVTRLTASYTDFDINPEWSPDRSLIVYEAHPWAEWNSATGFDLGGGVIRTITPTGRRGRTLAGGFTPSWAPDGRHIAFVRNHDIYVMGRKGQAVTQLTDTDAGDSDPAWSPDGRYILFASGTPSDLFVMETDGSGRRALTSSQTVANTSPTWSPDGKRIAWVAADQVTGQTDIWVMDADGTNARNVTSDAAKDYAVDWGLL